VIPLEVVSNSIAGGRGSGASYEFYKVIQSDWEFATDRVNPRSTVYIKYRNFVLNGRPMTDSEAEHAARTPFRLRCYGPDSEMYNASMVDWRYIAR